MMSFAHIMMDLKINIRDKSFFCQFNNISFRVQVGGTPGNEIQTQSVLHKYWFSPPLYGSKLKFYVSLC